jgi:hypothetical protein
MRAVRYGRWVRFQAEKLIGRPASLAWARELEQVIMEIYQAEYMVGGT